MKNEKLSQNANIELETATAEGESQQNKQPEETVKQEYNKIDGTEKLLWNKALKYKSYFDEGFVPKIIESEEDRKEVSDAYLFSNTTRHRQLDARVYQSLSKMQRTRDTKVALEGTTERDRLRMIAWEVKTRTQAVVFIPGDSTFDMDIFNLHGSSGVKIVNGEEEDKELRIEGEIFEDKGIAIIDSIPLRQLTIEQKENFKQQLLKELSMKKFRIDDLEKKLDSIFADLISLLVQEKKIVLVRKEPNSLEIIPMEDYSNQYEDRELLSQAILLTPKINQK